MRAVVNVVTATVLLLIAMGVVAFIAPWAWSTVTELVDSIARAARSYENAIGADVTFLLPTAMTDGNSGILFVFNSGAVTLTDARLKMIDRAFNMKDLNFVLIHLDGTMEGNKTDPLYVAPLFMPGELLVSILPPEDNYIGFTFVLQSREYSEALRVG